MLLAGALPAIFAEAELKIDSSSGVETSKLLVGVLGVSLGPGVVSTVGVVSTATVGDGVTFWACLRLLFAVQIPNVITKPIMNPITMARIGSFI